jgi:hypothetical protein
MKSIQLENLIANSKNKLVHYLDTYSPGKVLLIFDHGIGDIVEFLDLYVTLKEAYPKWTFNIGHHPSLDYTNLHPDIIKISDLNKEFVIPYGSSIVQGVDNVFFRYNMKELSKKYKIIANIRYCDFRHPSTKPDQIINRSKNEMCAFVEIGWDNVKLKTHTFNFDLDNKDSKQVVYHFAGHTDKSIKIPNENIQAAIWKEIVDAGYQPFDVHINSSSNIVFSKVPLPSFIDEKYSIRNKPMHPDLLLDVVKKSKYCVGVLSGPLHLCNRVYGSENCFGVQGQFKISNYISSPTPMDHIDIATYIPGKIYQWLKNKG